MRRRGVGGERDRCEVFGVSEVGGGDEGVADDGGGLVRGGLEGGADAGDARGRGQGAGGGACSDAVVAKQYALGRKLGIPGTPMIVISDGTSLGGYISPEKLLAVLKDHAAQADGKSHEQ
jgi:hypothetical protein